MPTNEDAVRRRLINNLIDALLATPAQHRRAYLEQIYQGAERHQQGMHERRAAGDREGAEQHRAWALVDVRFADVITHALGIEAREITNIERSLHDEDAGWEAVEAEPFDADDAEVIDLPADEPPADQPRDTDE